MSSEAPPAPTRMWPAATSLAALVFKIVTVEEFGAGAMHHLAEGAFVLLAAAAVHGLHPGQPRGARLVLFFGMLAWLLDALNVRTGRFELEGLLWCATHGALAWQLGRALAPKRPVGRAELACAAACYLAAGVACADFYSVLLANDPQGLRAIPEGSVPDYPTLLYFSFVTMATLGYGDVVPASPFFRAAAILQSLFGVLFIAVVMARVVALELSGAAPTQRSGDTP